MRTRTRIPQKNSIYNQEDNTIQTKNRLNDDGLNKMNNENFLVVKNSKVSGRRARYKVKSSFSSNLGKYESNELKNNYYKSLEGKVEELLTEKWDDGYLIGHLSNYGLCKVKTDNKETNEIFKVKLLSYENEYFISEII